MSTSQNVQKDIRTYGPLSDLEKHLPSEWWKTLFNAMYLKTDGDVVENDQNTVSEIDTIISVAQPKKTDVLLDLCCGQGRHCIELAKRGFTNVMGIDRSRYLVRLAKKRAQRHKLTVKFSEGDARRIRLPENSVDQVYILGNSFGYFEREEDDIAVLESIKKILKPNGKLIIDITDGDWMKTNFEARSWEWIDQAYFVCRERSLSSEGRRIISREVVVNAEIGVVADQFYAERLYNFESIQELLEGLNFKNVTNQGSVVSHSTRNQDLGLMQHRIFLSAELPDAVISKADPSQQKVSAVTVLMGDPSQADSVKKNGQFNQEDIETVQKLKESLKPLGQYEFTYLDQHKDLLESIKSKPPEFVFNLCDEGYNNDALKELHVPAYLEMLGIPYSGAAPAALGICYNKSLVTALADSLDIPVPLETYVDASDQTATMPNIFPAIVKPNLGDSSVGITKNALVHTAEELIEHMDYIKYNCGNVPILIQEFLSGDEFSVGIIGNAGKYRFLPILQVDYSKLEQSLPKILSYESKWEPDSPYWNQIGYFQAELSEDEQRQLYDYSIKLFERIECRDYARFDFRKDVNGTIKLLEVNPNPGWCWDGKLNLMASFEGTSYSQLLEQILQAAKERYI